MKERTNQILQSIMNSEMPIEIELLCSEYDIGPRMLRIEIGTINDELILHNLPLITIKRRKGYELKLGSEEQAKVKKIILGEDAENNYLTREERKLDLVLSIAFSNKPIFLNRKEEEYKVSKSTMDEDVRQIRSMLETYSLTLVSKFKLGLEIVGLEKNIQLMLFYLLSESFNSSKNWLKGAKYNKKIQIISNFIPDSLLEKLDSNYNRDISINDDMYKRNFVIYSSIWMLRYQDGHLVSTSNNKTKNTVILNYLNGIKEDFKIALSQSEENHICFMLDSIYRRDLTSTFEWGEAQLLTIRLIKYVENEFQLNFGERLSDLQSELFIHIAALLKRLNSDIQFLNPLTDRIKANYPEMFHVINEFSPEFLTITGKVISEDEVALLVIYFITLQTEIKEENQFYFKVVVICNHGTATGNLLVASLKKHFNIEIQGVLSSNEGRLIEKLDVDLVFSTVKINYTKKPVLLLNPIIRDLERQQIQRFLELNKNLRRKKGFKTTYADDFFKDVVHVFENNNYKLTDDIYKELIDVFQNNNLSIRKEKIQPMIKDVLIDDYIIIDQEADSWEEAIKLSAAPLLLNGLITDGYTKAIIKSVNEYGPYIVIGPHLALAHARPEDGALKMGLSVLKVKEPVPFHHDFNDPVQLVFCLSAVDNFSHLNIMRELVNLIHDPDKVEKLCQVNTVEDFKNILFN